MSIAPMSILTTAAVSTQEGDVAKELLGYFMSTSGFVLAMDHAPKATLETTLEASNEAPTAAGAIDPTR